MPITSILWDFGGTLADQDWMLTPPDGFPNWPEAWAESARGEREEAWNLGEVTCEEIAGRVAAGLGMPLGHTLDHIRRCCSSIRFFDAVLAVAKRCPLPQAIVTLNPDVFTRFVVPPYRLDETFPVIVASWQEGTVDKSALCTLALDRFDLPVPRGEALLIDNIAANVHDWEQTGGLGYVFRGEAQFLADLSSTLRALTP